MNKYRTCAARGYMPKGDNKWRLHLEIGKSISNSLTANPEIYMVLIEYDATTMKVYGG